MLPYTTHMVFIHTAEVIVSILLITCVLLQHRVAGLGATFGGSGATLVQRRGAEKVLYNACISLSVLFFGLSVLSWYIS